MKYLTIALLVASLALLVWAAGCRNQQAQTPPPPAVENTASTSSAEMPEADHMAPMKMETAEVGPDEASCPVLGTIMKKSKMIPMQHDGKTYYLCCRDCVAQFKADPEKYIANPAKPTHEMKHDD